MRFYLHDSCLTSFAHDTAIFCDISFDDLINEANIGLNDLNLFATIIILAINVKKTNLMAFS